MKKIISLILFILCFSTAVFANNVRFVQITDVRFSARDKNQSLSKLINTINKQKDIDFVVFTGDNIQKVSNEDLIAFLKEVKKIKKDTYVLIGDKDVNKHKDLSKKQYARLLKKKLRYFTHQEFNYVFEKGGTCFIVVDGAKDVIPGTNGYFKDDILAWLDINLSKHNKKNVVILQHFPLIPPNDNESYATYKPEGYLEILDNHPNVKAVVSGHFGVNSEINKDGIVHITTAPFPSYRVIDIIDSNTTTPTIWAEVRVAE